jgi:hypothetical protein
MEKPLTIAELDATTINWIEQEAQRSGTPVDHVVRRLIYRGLEEEQRRARRQRYHDLDALAGTWSAVDADEFKQGTADFNQIDPTLWP